MTAGQPARPDIIKVTGISAVGYHGVLEHERRNGQRFIVDVALHTDIRPAAAGDDLTKTANYAELADQVEAIITGEALQLIETLAERIADHVLRTFSVTGVEVTVHKPHAPIQVEFSDVSISIYREQP